MPNYTPELNLKKPLGTEFISITDLNDNFDKLDDAVIKIKVNGAYAGKASGEVDLGTVVAETVGAVTALPAAGDSTKLYSNAGKVWWWDGTQWVDVTATGGGGTITGIVSTTLDVTGTGTKAINLKATDQATLADVANKADADDVYTKTDADALLDDKVDKETGKGLSTNDYDNDEKADVAAAICNATYSAPAKITFTKNDNSTVDVVIADASASGAGAMSATAYNNLQSAFKAGAYTAATASTNAKMTFTKVDGNTVDVDMGAAGAGIDTLTNTDGYVNPSVSGSTGTIDLKGGVVVKAETATATAQGQKLTFTPATGTAVTLDNIATATELGTLSSLTTTAKTSAVAAVNELDAEMGNDTLTTTATTAKGAINELDAEMGSATLTTTDKTAKGAINELDAEMGTLSSLTTTEKGTIVGAINEIVGDNYVKSLSFTAETAGTPGILTIGKKTGTDVTLNLEQYLKSVSGTDDQIIVDTTTDGTVIAPKLKLDDDVVIKAEKIDDTVVTGGGKYKELKFTPANGTVIDFEDIVDITVLGDINTVVDSMTAKTVAGSIGALKSVKAQDATGAVDPDATIASMFGDFSDATGELITKEIPLKDRQSVMSILEDLRKLLDVEYKEANKAVTSGTQYTWTVSNLKWGDDTAYTADEVNFEVELGDTTNGMHIQQGIDSITFSGTTATILWTANQTGTYNVYGRVHKKLYKSGTIAG